MFYYIFNWCFCQKYIFFWVSKRKKNLKCLLHRGCFEVLFAYLNWQNVKFFFLYKNGKERNL